MRSFVGAYGGRHMSMEAIDETNLRRSVRDVLGQDRMPDFDIDNSNYIISFGADWLSTWMAPVRFGRGYGHFRHNRGKARGTLVHVDSRFSMTAANADDWIPVAPGMEGAVALSIAYAIISEGHGLPDAVQQMIGGDPDNALETALGDYAPEKIVDPGSSTYAGIPPTIRGEESAHLIRRVAKDFATHGPSLAFGGGAAGAQTHGEANLSAVYALNHLVGDRVPGRLGNVIFNPAPPISGLMPEDMPSSLSDLNQAVDDVASGSIGLVMVYGANPVYAIPLKSDGTGLADAINGRQDPDDLFVIAFANVLDDTSALADLVLPVREALEDWGDDVPEPGPGYQVMAIQQPVVEPLPDIQAASFPDEIINLSKSLRLNDGDSALVVAGYLETYYTALETFFVRVSGYFESDLPQGCWHAILLEKMNLEIGGIRAKVVGDLKPRPPPRVAPLSYDWARIDFLLATPGRGPSGGAERSRGFWCIPPRGPRPHRPGIVSPPRAAAAPTPSPAPASALGRPSPRLAASPTAPRRSSRASSPGR